MTSLDQLQSWLEAAVRRSRTNPESFDLSLISDEQLSILAADLEGINDSAQSLAVDLSSITDARPSGEELEDHLVEIGSHLEHARWHWQSVLNLLSETELWPDEDPHPGEGGPDAEQCVLDESSSWPFASPSDQGVYVTDDVSKEGLPVLMVSHDEEDNWSFSGGEDFDLDRTHLIHLGWVVNHDPSLRQLADLPAGWGAFREGAGEPWELFEMDEEDEDEAEED